MTEKEWQAMLAFARVKQGDWRAYNIYKHVIWDLSGDREEYQKAIAAYCKEASL